MWPIFFSTSGRTEATFSYDDRYNQPSGQHIDFNGNTTTYTLDSEGRDVEKITYAGGSGIA